MGGRTGRKIPKGGKSMLEDIFGREGGRGRAYSEQNSILKG